MCLHASVFICPSPPPPHEHYASSASGPVRGAVTPRQQAGLCPAITRSAQVRWGERDDVMPRHPATTLSIHTHAYTIIHAYTYIFMHINTYTYMNIHIHI